MSAWRTAALAASLLTMGAVAAGCGGDGTDSTSQSAATTTPVARQASGNEQQCRQNLSYRCTKLTVHNDVPGRVMWVEADNRQLIAETIRLAPGETGSVVGYNHKSSYQMGALVKVCQYDVTESSSRSCPKYYTVRMTGVELCNPSIGTPSAYVTPWPTLQVPCRGTTFSQGTERKYDTAWNWLVAVLKRNDDSYYYKEWDLRVRPRA